MKTGACVFGLCAVPITGIHHCHAKRQVVNQQNLSSIDRNVNESKIQKKTLMWMQSSWSAWHCEHLELSSPAHHHNSHALLLSFEGNCSCNTSSRLWTKLRRISKRSGLDEHYQKVEETRKQGQTTQLQIELHNFTSSTCHMAKSNIQWQRYATNQKHRILS